MGISGARWASISAGPAELTEAEHEAWCSAGFLSLELEPGDFSVASCPRCDAEKARARTEREIRDAGIGERYWHVEWEDLEDVPPVTHLRRAADSIGDVLASGDSLLLHGPPGSGKTQAAVLLLKAAINTGRSARLENLGMLSARIREGYDGDGPSEAGVIEGMSGVDLLVLDDIGAGETGAAKIEKRVLYLVTEARQNARRSTIVTTNLSPQELTDAIGARIINRLQPLEVLAFRHGRNFRKPTTRTAWAKAGES